MKDIIESILETIMVIVVILTIFSPCIGCTIVMVILSKGILGG